MSEPIEIRSWMNLSGFDKSFDHPHVSFLPNTSYVYVPLEQIYHFFKLCKQSPDRKFVIVSGNTDFGLFLQNNHPVNGDLRKRISFIPWDQIPNSNSYISFKIGPACDSDRCEITDKYSIKTYAHTTTTFDDIPENVLHWFTTNANIEHPKITCIPMGIGSPNDYTLLHSVKQEKIVRQHLLYVNFTNYTEQRIYLKEYYAKQPWATVEKSEISKEEYYRQLHKHFFVLCPPGNGLDCYRMWETLYCGAVPIVENSIWSKHLQECLPIYGDLFSLTSELLVSLVERCGKFVDLINQDKRLELSYWTDRIYKKCEEMGV